MRPLLSVLALAVCATAQQPTPGGLSPQAPKPPADGVIFGTVVNTVQIARGVGRRGDLPDVPANPFGRLYDGTCKAGAECTVMPLPPGRYRAIAFPGPNSSHPNLHDPEVWQRLRPWARDVTLVPGSNPTIRLAPAPED